jgi:hypothetical protein
MNLPAITVPPPAILQATISFRLRILSVMAGQQLDRRLSMMDPLTREFTKRETGTVLARWVTT